MVNSTLMSQVFYFRFFIIVNTLSWGFLYYFTDKNKMKEKLSIADKRILFVLPNLNCILTVYPLYNFSSFGNALSYFCFCMLWNVIFYKVYVNGRVLIRKFIILYVYLVSVIWGGFFVLFI